MQASLRQALSDRPAAPVPYPHGRFAGRGVVTCAGGMRYFTCAWVLIWVLRRVHKCPLPIQVWHLGSAEMSEGMRLILEEEGVEVVDAEKVVARHPARVSGGWPLKPYAIAQSRFEEVLFLDADTVPLADPQAVFDWEAFQRGGMLTWPDVVDLRKENPVWARLGLPPRACVSVESGVLAVDKRRAWDVLTTAVMLNEHWEEVYDLVHGDKDTFLLASLLCGRELEQVAHRPLMLGADLIQRDPHGAPFVHHRTCTKWNLRGSNRPMIKPALDAACQDALAELRRRWSGVVFHPPARSPRALAQEAELIATRWFHYTAGGGSRRFELLSASRVGEGRGEFERHWAVIERDDGAPVLQFFSDTRLGVELDRQADGSWFGQSIGEPVFEALLIPAESRALWPSAGAKPAAPSSAPHLAALLDASLFAAGFDPALERELQGALSVLNRVFEDVPEQWLQLIAASIIEADWRRRLAEMAPSLAQGRAQRLALTKDRAVLLSTINPAHYERVT